MSKESVINTLAILGNYSEVPFCIFSENHELVHCSYLEKSATNISILRHVKNYAYGIEMPETIVFNGIELYGLFDYTVKDEKLRFLIGPVLTVKPMAEINLALLSFADLFGVDRIRKIIRQIPLMTSSKFTQYMQLVNNMVTGKKYDYEDLLENRIPIETAPIFRSDSSNDTVEDPNLAIRQPDSEDIELIIGHVKAGATDALGNFLEKSAIVNTLFSKSQHENHNVFIAATAIIAKTAIEGGIGFNDALAIAITFIEYAENTDINNDLSMLFKTMIISFATRVNEENNLKQFPIAIKKAVNYIDNHLHYSISLEDIAKHVNLSRAYLSQLFATKTGTPLQKYIKTAKIREAEEMLKYSQRSIAEISETFAFCSQSYFTEVFKEINGITPVKYRKLHH